MNMLKLKLSIFGYFSNTIAKSREYSLYARSYRYRKFVTVKRIAWNSVEKKIRYNNQTVS